MKKIMVALFFLATIIAGNSARAQQRHKFYYYPQSNVYYDPVNRQYIYYDNSNNWTTIQTLPSTITVQRTPRVMVYSNSPEVWRMNA